MKLKQFVVPADELQTYLDKYQNKIKFILYTSDFRTGAITGVNQYLLIIDIVP